MNRNTGRMIGAASVAALGIVAGLALSRTRQTVQKAAMALTGDWEKQLKAEHVSVKKALTAMTRSDLVDTVKRAALLAGLDESLTRHTLEEEKVIYPALKAAGAGSVVDELYTQHGEMKTIVRSLQELSAEDPEWLERAKALRRLFTRHVKGEELLFPLLHELSDDQRNKTLTTLVRREAVRLS
jgi:iron-sulfur cluster repair protein YtfE (RIC family)